MIPACAGFACYEATSKKSLKERLVVSEHFSGLGNSLLLHRQEWLCHRTNAEFWLNLQNYYDLECERRAGKVSEIERQVQPAGAE